MKDPNLLNRAQLITLAIGQKSMIANLQAQLKKALDSNVALYKENKQLKEVATTP